MASIELVDGVLQRSYGDMNRRKAGAELQERFP
jgi:hypothetical protein